jgi:hypothetical protein
MFDLLSLSSNIRAKQIKELKSLRGTSEEAITKKILSIILD